jgi:hypothetical protein
MVLVHVGTVVVLTTSETSTTGMLAVLSYTTVAVGDMAAKLAGLRSTGRHGDGVWVLSLWCFASRTWKWAVMFFAVHRMGQVRKIVSERAALP